MESGLPQRNQRVGMTDALKVILGSKHLYQSVEVGSDLSRDIFSK
jgi:hypothetical protein